MPNPLMHYHGMAWIAHGLTPGLAIAAAAAVIAAGWLARRLARR